MADLPEISAFLTKPSDRFLVDVKEVSRGHPLLGVNSPHLHGGAHVHFDNTKNRWPKGKDESRNYPAIYAVADGVVSRIDTHFALSGGNDRYGLDLTFADFLCSFPAPSGPGQLQGRYRSLDRKVARNPVRHTPCPPAPDSRCSPDEPL